MVCECGKHFCFICGISVSGSETDHWSVGQPCPRSGRPGAPDAEYDFDEMTERQAADRAIETSKLVKQQFGAVVRSMRGDVPAIVRYTLRLLEDLEASLDLMRILMDEDSLVASNQRHVERSAGFAQRMEDFEERLESWNNDLAKAGAVLGFNFGEEPLASALEYHNTYIDTTTAEVERLYEELKRD